MSLGMLLVGGDTALGAPWAQCDMQGDFPCHLGRAQQGKHRSRAGIPDLLRGGWEGQDGWEGCQGHMQRKGTRGKAKG